MMWIPSRTRKKTQITSQQIIWIISNFAPSKCAIIHAWIPLLLLPKLFDLTYFHSLFRNPYNIECFAQYGGPVDPALALGGFLKDNEAITDPKQYQNATATIITILLKNYHNKTLLTPALEWESR